MKESNESIKGGTGGSVADTSKSDLKRGYSTVEEPQRDNNVSFEDESPSNDGFVGRPQGWER